LLNAVFRGLNADGNVLLELYRREPTVEQAIAAVAYPLRKPALISHASEKGNLLLRGRALVGVANLRC
jgi:hypothetical protein